MSYNYEHPEKSQPVAYFWTDSRSYFQSFVTYQGQTTISLRYVLSILYIISLYFQYVVFS